MCAYVSVNLLKRVRVSKISLKLRHFSDISQTFLRPFSDLSQTFLYKHADKLGGLGSASEVSTSLDIALLMCSWMFVSLMIASRPRVPSVL